MQTDHFPRELVRSHYVVIRAGLQSARGFPKAGSGPTSARGAPRPTPGRLENWAPGAAVRCSRCAPEVAMETANTAATPRKGTCRSSGARPKMNGEQAEFRTGSQLLVPRGVLISFSFLFLFPFQRIDRKHGCVIKHPRGPPTPPPDLTATWHVLGIDVY